MKTSSPSFQGMAAHLRNIPPRTSRKPPKRGCGVNLLPSKRESTARCCHLSTSFSTERSTVSLQIPVSVSLPPPTALPLPVISYHPHYDASSVSPPLSRFYPSFPPLSIAPRRNFFLLSSRIFLSTFPIRSTPFRTFLHPRRSPGGRGKARRSR